MRRLTANDMRLDRVFFGAVIRHLVGPAWLAVVAVTITLICFRGVKASGIGGAIQFDDVPMLRHFDTNYHDYYTRTTQLAFAVASVLIVGVWIRSGMGNPFKRDTLRRPKRDVLIWIVGLCLFLYAAAVACEPDWADTDLAEVEPIGDLDWAGLAGLGVCGWLMPAMLFILLSWSRPHDPTPPRPTPKTSFLIRNAMMYLLGTAAVMLYALRDHQKFWDPDKNGGYDYRPVFREDELMDADRVLYSTSLLFASLAALGGLIVVGMFRTALKLDARRTASGAGSSVTEGMCVSVLSSLVWAGLLIVPWQRKLLPELTAEGAWIMPISTLIGTTVALIPMMHMSWLMMTWDFERRAARRAIRRPDKIPFVPRRSELALWNFVLFPVYPYLRIVRIAGAKLLYLVLTVASGAMIAAMTWFAVKADEMFDFEDWRGMLRAGLFPVLQVAFALLCACHAYIVLRRVGIVLGCHFFRRRAPLDIPPSRLLRGIGRIAACVPAAAILAAASWPFWGWKNVHENVFARVCEHSHRHEFELTFLHWLFDLDRDGYAAVLHGPAPSEFEGIQPGELDPPRDDNDVPIDAFEVVDADKARKLPNVLFLFLEGVTPTSISAYRKILDEEKRIPNVQYTKQNTPNIDSVARDGTMFMQARCFYPSTWDGWYSTVTGRFLRIKEMDMARPFGDRYNRYNNLYKVLRLAGIDRWCHMNCPPFYKCMVPQDMAPTAWMPNFDSSLSKADEERDIWRGDKRNQRILSFLDSLKPGERFFVIEHMADTHFPWKPIKDLQWAAEDAVLTNGTRNSKYTHYFQNVTRMDRQVGELLKKLKDKKLYDDTIIVILSDHGCQWWEHEHLYYVSHLYDQSLLVPAIVKVPGIKGGGKVDDPVLQVDILPTFMELAGVRQTNPRDDYPLPGRSLVPLMKGTATAAQKAAFKERDVPLTTHYDNLGVISHFKHKLIFNRTQGTYLLFDLERDPMETTNIVDDEPELRKELLAKLRFLIRQNPAIIGGIKQASEGWRDR